MAPEVRDQLNEHKAAGEPVEVTIDEARGALGPKETSSGDTIIPTLAIGLALVVAAFVSVAFIV